MCLKIHCCQEILRLFYWNLPYFLILDLETGRKPWNLILASSKLVHIPGSIRQNRQLCKNHKKAGRLINLPLSALNTQRHRQYKAGRKKNTVWSFQFHFPIMKPESFFRDSCRLAGGPNLHIISSLRVSLPGCCVMRLKSALFSICIICVLPWKSRFRVQFIGKLRPVTVFFFNSGCYRIDRQLLYSEGCFFSSELTLTFVFLFDCCRQDPTS